MTTTWREGSHFISYSINKQQKFKLKIYEL